MTKNQLIKFVAQSTDREESDVTEIVDEFLTYIKYCMQQREVVSISGFGTFKPRLRKAGVAINPRTMERIEVPAQLSMSFKASRMLKEELNKTE